MKDIYKLTDLFARYLLGKNGNEDLLIDLVNATLTDFDFEEVKDLEIIDHFNIYESFRFVFDSPRNWQLTSHTDEGWQSRNNFYH